MISSTASIDSTRAGSNTSLSLFFPEQTQPGAQYGDDSSILDAEYLNAKESGSISGFDEISSEMETNIRNLIDSENLQLDFAVARGKETRFSGRSMNGPSNLFVYRGYWPSRNVQDTIRRLSGVFLATYVGCKIDFGVSPQFLGGLSHSENLNFQLSDWFVYRGYLRIKNYLRKNPQLRDLLVTTYLKLKEYFGDEPQFALELVPDIYEPAYEQLFVRVVSTQDFSKNLEILNTFENEWWFERTGYVINSPVITIE